MSGRWVRKGPERIVWMDDETEAELMRHAGHDRLMDPEPGEYRGYAPGCGPERGGERDG